MNRLVLQQETARSLSAAANPLADRTAAKLAGVGASSPRSQDISADRPASFAHTLDRKTKVQPKDKPKDTSKNERAEKPEPSDKPSPTADAGKPRAKKKAESSDETDQTPSEQPEAEAPVVPGDETSSFDVSQVIDGTDVAPDAKDVTESKETPAKENAPAPSAPVPLVTVALNAPADPKPAAAPEPTAVQKPETQATVSPSTSAPPVPAPATVIPVAAPQASAPTPAIARPARTAKSDTPAVTTATSSDPPAATDAADAPASTDSTPAPTAASASMVRAAKVNARADGAPTAKPVTTSRPPAHSERSSDEGGESTEADGFSFADVMHAGGAAEAAAKPRVADPLSSRPEAPAPVQATTTGKSSADQPILQPAAATTAPEKVSQSNPEVREMAPVSPASLVTARTLDLLGRLVTESAASPAQTSSGGQVAPEFQRALQAQVERGIEQAAQQAAAAGTWAGVGVGTSGSVTLRLHPANLGMMRVYLRMDTEGGGGGGVRARFEVSSGRTKGLLGSSMASLRSALESRGLTVTDVSVTEMAQMPERGLGLPPVSGPDESSGPGFASMNGVGNFGPIGSESAGDASGACATGPAETGEADNRADDVRWESGERPVALAALFARSSPMSIGADGRVLVNALV